ncbi:hypothetical protein STHERM_c08140 [Spirochaeta thermophila DSM 6192]|uniref:Uncharacterized protein n=1 Tax=Winmispira thermophila (strain ATCC 49972 / DSM 6192 / RI 19.B1) TaxID=665571 RepID=E0RRX7_WINT6|nr:hypothetical protein STHERM_c08140 [Spirochaeta thermophila DSM 6192]
MNPSSFSYGRLSRSRVSGPVHTFMTCDIVYIESTREGLALQLISLHVKLSVFFFR